MRRRFHQEIVAWREDTIKLCLASRISDKSAVSSFWSEEWYEAVYNNAMLLLYRPSPYLPRPTMTPGIGDENPDLLELLNASKSSIQAYSTLHRKRKLNYSWNTLHGIFVAGLAYVYSVGRILREPINSGVVPDILSIIDITRSCSNILIAICERWSVSRRSCEPFNSLSNAVIRDSLQLAVRPGTGVESRPDEDMRSVGVRSASDDHTRDQKDGSLPSWYLPLQESMFGEIPQLEDFFGMEEYRPSLPPFLDPLPQKGTPFSREVASGFSQSLPLAFLRDGQDESGP